MSTSAGKRRDGMYVCIFMSISNLKVVTQKCCFAYLLVWDVCSQMSQGPARLEDPSAFVEDPHQVAASC